MATGLATRCTACGTIFRVVPDQLRVSDGWVRCGRCNEVFNASATLIDLETGGALVGSDPSPPGASAPAVAPASPPAAAARPWAPAAQAAPAAASPRAPAATPPSPSAGAPFAPLSMPPAPAPMPLRAARDDAAATAPDEAAAPARPAPATGGWNRRREPAAPIEPSWGTPEAADADGNGPSSDLPVVDDAASRFPDVTADPPPEAARPAELPSFVRRAERARRWRSTPVRAALGAVGAIAALGLALQVVHEWREVLAARQPALRPALEAGCALVGCRVDAVRSIEGLTVESSGLVRVEKSSIYKLTVSLRNRSGIELTLPALELSLNDGQGQLVARRVLNAPELGVNQTTLAAGRELALQATLQAATPPVAGYTIELFYP